MFNPAKAAEEIKKEYMGYITTTYHFRDPEIREQFKKELEEIISNGPFVEIKDTFETGRSIGQLIDDGILSPLFYELERGKKYKPKLSVERPLYLHQEKAVRKITAGKNVVVSTGTGSGKTYCFLIPVINALLQEQKSGMLNDGVRAIFIYPMNALANDQIKGLREILMDYPQITFGVYNGSTEYEESAAVKLYEAMYANERYPELRTRLKNERLSRDDMKKHPPHILFTNYAMLEHLLFRPGDDVLFSGSNFKFVVLDEAHVYGGAVGIETALLIGRLKARLGNSKPQFILTSATLGDPSAESKAKVVEFASQLTGCAFEQEDIIYADRRRQDYSGTNKLSENLFIELAAEEKSVKRVLADRGIVYDKDHKEEEILYDLIVGSDLYANMRKLGEIISFNDFAERLHISRQAAVAFVSQCAKAKKGETNLIDIRYHYFLRALDGGYMAIDHPQSFSLTRKEMYGGKVKMFEVGVCDDCGKIVIIGKHSDGKLVRAGVSDDREYYQIIENGDKIDNDEDLSDDRFILCKNCGALIEADQAHNDWCVCGNCAPVTTKRIKNEKCLNCGGNLRRLQLGYDAATAVIATSLFEQIPETTVTFEESSDKPDKIVKKSGLFTSASFEAIRKEKTGSQFLVFSDSRQGAAKFACYMESSYKEFLRRRGIWNIAKSEGDNYPNGISVSELVSLLNNYYSSLQLFRESNADNAVSNMIDNKRNAWIAVLNELYNSGRDTSLVSMGKLQFDYFGNNDKIVDIVVQKYGVDRDPARAFLDYLAFEIVREGAVVPDKETDINDEDRKYIFFTQIQQVVTKTKNNELRNSKSYLPAEQTKKNGEQRYYASKKLSITKDFLRVSDEEAVNFLKEYWEYLVSPDDNKYCLQTSDGRGYYMKASSIRVRLGNGAVLWRCKNCHKVTQFNIENKCRHPHCGGKLERFVQNADDMDNYYALLYDSDKLTPLFIKEHTAQLAKKEALEYQQMFVRKEINALSCSTTFEMGVDVGGLETVFLRNVPPLASNYAQRAGRAGRSINAAAFALTYARLSSHDFTFFEHPEEMISGVIYPPQFKLENEKIIKRHIYAVAISLYLKLHDELYDGNDAEAFINAGAYKGFLEWLKSRPVELKTLLKNSLPRALWDLPDIALESFGWLDDFCGENGRFSILIRNYENDVEYLERERKKALKTYDAKTADLMDRKLKQYKNNELIDFLVRGNILPKYGFPVDAVELAQNISSKEFKSLNLNRDLSVAIAEYAPSAEVVADGGLYTSRYIKKPIVNKNKMSSFDISYIATCPKCKQINYSNMPIGSDGRPCAICGNILRSRDFCESIEPRSGFIAEYEVKSVPQTTQERKYRTEAVYIGDKNAYPINTYSYHLGKVRVNVQSTTNDSLVVRSTEWFYVCNKCGYAIAADETSKLSKYDDYSKSVKIIKKGPKHAHPFGSGSCDNTELSKYGLHHEFKTDVAKIEFETDTSDYATMLSVMYALLNAFADVLSIEKRDVRACLTYEIKGGRFSHQVIIYDAVPGGAGHSGRLVTEAGDVLKAVIARAIKMLSECTCDPSCYKCLRSYENQKVHEMLDRNKALEFLLQFQD
mgnify:CR=1 FL=1